MKRKIFGLAILMLISGLVGCSGSSGTNASSDMIKAPGAATDFKGKDVNSVVAELEKAGFSTLEKIEIKDISAGSQFKSGDVERVKIDGSEDFAAGKEFSKNAKVEIAYHLPAEFKAKININFPGNLLFSKYNVRLVVNGTEIATMEHGNSSSYNATVRYGDNTIDFINAEKSEVKGETKLNVSGDTDVSYTIECKKDKVLVTLESGNGSSDNNGSASSKAETGSTTASTTAALTTATSTTTAASTATAVTGAKENPDLLCYVKRGTEYYLYYIVDMKNKVAYYSSSHDTSVHKAIFTDGDNLNSGIIVTFEKGTQDEFHEKIYWHYVDSDSTLMILDANGYEDKFTKTDFHLLPDHLKEAIK